MFGNWKRRRVSDEWAVVRYGRVIYTTSLRETRFGRCTAFVRHRPVRRGTRTAAAGEKQCESVGGIVFIHYVVFHCFRSASLYIYIIYYYTYIILSSLLFRLLLIIRLVSIVVTLTGVIRFPNEQLTPSYPKTFFPFSRTFHRLTTLFLPVRR